MPLITSSSLIRGLALLHATTAYYLLTAPTRISSQNLVLILGQSMRIPLPSAAAFHSANHATAFAAVILAFLALVDFSAVAMLPEDVASYYWSSQAPVRVAFWMGVSSWIYVLRPAIGQAALGQQGWGGSAKNSLVFTMGFVETAAWFWVFILLRDERRQQGLAAQEKRRREEAGM